MAGLGWQPFCPRCWPSSEGRSLLARGRGHLPEEGRDSQHFGGGPGDGRCDGTMSQAWGASMALMRRYLGKGSPRGLQIPPPGCL